MDLPFNRLSHEGQPMNHRPVLVLLNPPAPGIIIRDNYCSKVSQASYINHPIDLVIQSGYLQNDFDLTVVDAIVEPMNPDQCLEKLTALNPYGIYALAGNASWESDIGFFQQLRACLPQIRLAVSGDIFLEDPAAYLERCPELDAVVMDFTTPALHRFFSGERENLPDLVYRHEDRIQDDRRPRNRSGSFSVPVPAHQLFEGTNYRYPFVRNRRFRTVMTEYGCPFRCAFCVMGTLGHKRRPIDNVMEELQTIRRMGIRDIFFIDQSFGSDPERNRVLCARIENELPGLRWVCFSRVDLVNEEILKRMKSAGCHTIIFGVETASESMLAEYRKGYTLDQVRALFTITRRLRIRTVATFLLGLPGETWESALETITFARTLNCDFASINIAVPRMGTDLRKQAIETGIIDPNLVQFDQSGTDIVMETATLSRQQLAALKKRAVRDIYLRPTYVIRRLLAIRSWDEFIIQVREGLCLFRKFLA